MSRPGSNIIVTTTSTLDGWDILEYLGVTSTHVVAGTGLISDTLASLSDFFGGRSGAYQRQLAAIDTEAIELLRSEALRRGGNAIIGVRVDHDEISGKGKSMLMCTAQGTIVVAKRNMTESSVRSVGTETLIPAADIINASQRKTLLEKLDDDEAALPSPEEWRFIIEQRAAEFTSWVSNKLGQELPYEQAQSFKESALAFLGMLPSEVVSDALFSSLENAKQPNQVLDSMEKLQVGDLERAQATIQNPALPTGKRGLAAAACHQRTYSAADISKLESMLTLIPSRFPRLAPIREEKGLFGRKELWDCPNCATKVEAKVERCISCFHDAWGFGPSDVSPEHVLSRLRARRNHLQELLGRDQQKVSCIDDS